jgi:hypothetical protein
LVVPTATGEQAGHAVQQRLAPRLAQAQAEVGQLGGAAGTDAITQARDGDLEGAAPSPTPKAVPMAATRI